MTKNAVLPLGKLPVELLAGLLSQAPIQDPRVLYGPGIGMDCAVIDLGERVLVFKTDPITFATDDIGWYAVQINANDIATTGATPRWMLVTLLLPENQTTQADVEAIFAQVYRAAAALGISVVGGHTEVTHGLQRAMVAGTMIGEVTREDLVIPALVEAGDRLLLTKGVPIEATALLAREFAPRLQADFTPAEIEAARQYLYNPGISVVRDARIATQAGRVHAMHDPTEGGLAGALWELADACQKTVHFDPRHVPIPALSARICAAFGLDPLATIASGALLLAAAAADSAAIQAAFEAQAILCCDIGSIADGPAAVRTDDGTLYPRPARDEIARVYEQPNPTT